MERLKELKTDIYRCIHCKACQFAYSGQPSRKGVGEHKGVLYEGMLRACPAQIEYGWEAYSNAGKVWIARAVLEGEIELDENVADVIYPCITCGLCSVQCENDVRTVDIIEALRAAVLEAGVPARDKHELVTKVVAKENNPYGGKKAERMDWVKEAGIDTAILNNKDAKIGYFVGCTAAYRQKNIAGATVKLLQKVGLDVTVLTDEVCCGSPYFRVGKIDTAKRLMNDNIALFNRFDLVLFSCAGCYRTLTIDYPKWTGEENKFKTQHAMELVAQLITEGKVEFKEHKDLKGKVVTYHDPCHTGRHFAEHFKHELIKESDNLFMDKRKLKKKVDAWFEVPRTIIKALPGITFNEMYRIKQDSFCCGAGGGVRAQYPEFSLNTASKRLDEAEAVKADIMLTECPFCWRNLSDANDRDNHGIPVYGILELIDTYDLIKGKAASKKK